MTPVTTQPRMWSSRPEVGDRNQRPRADDGHDALLAGILHVKEASLGGADIGVDRRLSVMTHGRLLLGATPLGQPSDASPRLIDGAGRRRRGGGRGHPAGANAGESPGRRHHRPGGQPVRPGRGGAGARAGRRDQSRRDGAGGQRRRDAADQRPRLPAGRGVRGGRPSGDVLARPVGGDDRAGRVRSAGGEVLLRGFRPAQEGGAREPGWPRWPTSGAPACSSNRRAGWRRVCATPSTNSAVPAGRRSAGS